MTRFVYQLCPATVIMILQMEIIKLRDFPVVSSHFQLLCLLDSDLLHFLLRQHLSSGTEGESGPL